MVEGVYYLLNYHTWKFDIYLGTKADLRKPIEEGNFLHFYAFSKSNALTKTHRYREKHLPKS